MNTGNKLNQIVVGLVGNPNCGKTTIFNRITGARHKVANWSGVTVEKREGFFKSKGVKIKIVDLPGIYSLSPFSIEEIITRNFIIDEKPDVIINIVDAGNLERNLYLTTQLINIGARVVLALNMYDEATHKGISIDTKKLGTLLGIPIVKTIGVTGEGIQELLETVSQVAENKNATSRHIHIHYGNDIEKEIKLLQNEIRTDALICDKYSTRWLAIRLLENDKDVIMKLANYPSFDRIIAKANTGRDRLEKLYNDDTNTVFTEIRHGFISGALKETVAYASVSHEQITDKIDRFVLNRYLGYPLLIIFLVILFQLTFVLGEYPIMWIEKLFSGLAAIASSLVPGGFFQDLLVNGIINGMGSVAVFLPSIVILFMGISFMEDTGYMARAAFIMDRIMHGLGIHGKSFIPLIMGFGCNVPAIMATRNLENRRDRILTILINPFMSCSARLPVYVLFAGIFFSKIGGIIIIIMYFIGVLMAYISARIFKLLFFKGQTAPFVLELPPYRIPTVKTTLLHMWDRSSQYLRKIGGVILVFSIIIWFLSTYPRTDAAEQSPDHIAGNTTAFHQNSPQHTHAIERTYIGMIGRTIEPVIKPLGFNWRMGVSLISGIAAKEIVISTLGIIYNPQNRQGNVESHNLHENLKNPVYGFTPLIAFVFMLFVLLYIPCFATITTIGHEIGWNWALFSVTYNLVLTWCVCFVVYRVGIHITHIL